MMLEDVAFVGMGIAFMFALAIGYIIMKLDRIENDLFDVKYYGGINFTDWGDERE